MSVSGLSKAISGLMANQRALQTTAHNLSNVNTPGFVRQQVLMKESSYVKIGSNGKSNFMVGLGTDIQEIRQVRDMFLDRSLREESSRYGYYNAQYNAIEEIEVIMGETEGESFSKILDDLWQSVNELSKHPDGLETRGTFVQSAVMFVNKSNLIMEQFGNYQSNLNQQIEDMVSEINNLGEEILVLNQKISRYEINGDNANDYRDARNSALDKLAQLVDISYREDELGNVFVKAEGYQFVTIGDVNEIVLEQAEPKSQLVKPVWKATGKDVLYFNTGVSPSNENDSGALKGLLLARGTRRANWTDTLDPVIYEQQIKPSMIMNAQAQFDVMVHGIVTMVNDLIAPNTSGPPPMKDTANSPYGLDGSRHIELFVRKGMDRYDALDQYNEEINTNPYSLYTAGNLEINPLIMEDYDKIALSNNPNAIGDNQLIEQILTKWQEPFASLEPGATSQLNYNEYYASFISNLGNEGHVANSQMKNQQTMLTQIDNQRSMLTGVSSDEELGNMMKYQHAYNASARVVTVIDQMIEQIVTNLGLVGR